MRIVLILVLSIVAFGASFVGVYMVVEPTVAASDPPAVDDPDSTAVVPADSLGREAWDASIAAQGTLMTSLVDSLTVARAARLSAEDRAEALQQRIDELERQLQSRENRREVAAAMASTLPKLDVNELMPILDGLDDRSLDDLYRAASSRNRTAILQALKPERASALVERFISEAETPAPDSTENAQTSTTP